MKSRDKAATKDFSKKTFPSKLSFVNRDDFEVLKLLDFPLMINGFPLFIFVSQEFWRFKVSPQSNERFSQLDFPAERNEKPFSFGAMKLFPHRWPEKTFLEGKTFLADLRAERFYQ
jgi:hypothetical protein